MIGALTLYQSTIGKKAVMAVTGFILFGYLVLHLWGNLKIFSGPVALNEYAVFLREVGAPLFTHELLLWIVRVILLASVVLHIYAAYQLTRLDLESRPVRYAQRKNITSTYAARTMRWGGVIIALFVVYHILHFTTGTAHPNFVQGDIYRNVVVGFSNPLVSAVYIVAMIAVGLHLFHGLWSMAQTLGWRTRNSDGLWRGFATITAGLLTLGNVSIPLAVLLGFVR